MQTDWNCHYWCHGDEELSNPNGVCGQAAERDSPSEVNITHFPWQVQVLGRRRGGYEFVCSGALLVRLWSSRIKTEMQSNPVGTSILGDFIQLRFTALHRLYCLVTALPQTEQIPRHHCRTMLWHQLRCKLHSRPRELQDRRGQEQGRIV